MTAIIVGPKESMHGLSMAGLGNFDDREGHYVFTFTPEGRYAHTVKNMEKKYQIYKLKTRRTATRFELVDLLFLDIFELENSNIFRYF